MSRRECKHGATCGADYCILDNDWFLIECDSYEDSGWRHPLPRKREILDPMLEEAKKALSDAEHERPRFGDATLAQRIRAARSRVSRIAREMRYAQ